MKHRNKVARDLRSPKYRKRVVQDKRFKALAQSYADEARNDAEQFRDALDRAKDEVSNFYGDTPQGNDDERD